MSDVLAVRDEYRAQQWAMLIQESKTSGMTNKDFCIQRGTSEKSFYYWQKRLCHSLCNWNQLLSRQSYFKSASGEQS